MVVLMSILADVYFHTVLFPAVQMADGGDWTMLTNISGTRKLQCTLGKTYF